MNKDHLKLCRGGFNHAYHSNLNSRSRGVAILHRNVQFIETITIKDKHALYIIVVGKLFNMPVVLANKIYTPNWDNVQFFKDLFSLLPNLDTHNLIVGGDLNCVLDSTLDRSSPTTNVLSQHNALTFSARHTVYLIRGDNKGS